MSPPVVACYTQKHSVFLLKRTRLLPSAGFAFAASKRTAKTEGITTARKRKCETNPKCLSFRLRMAMDFARSFY